MDITSSQIDFHNSPVINFPFPSPTTTTLTNAGTGTSLISNGTGPYLTEKTVSAGTGIQINDVSNNLEIVATGTPTPYTLSDTGTGVGLVAFSSGGGPNFIIKGIIPGTGIAVTDYAGSAVQIDSTISGTSLSGTGSAQTLVYSGSAPNFQTKDIQAGSNMSFSDNGTYITLNASGGSGGYTSTQNSSSLTWDNSISGTLQAWTQVTTTGSGNNSLLYDAGSGLNNPPRFMELQAGFGCTITNNGTYYTISVP